MQWIWLAQSNLWSRYRIQLTECQSDVNEMMWYKMEIRFILGSPSNIDKRFQTKPNQNIFEILWRLQVKLSIDAMGFCRYSKVDLLCPSLPNCQLYWLIIIAVFEEKNAPLSIWSMTCHPKVAKLVFQDVCHRDHLFLLNLAAPGFQYLVLCLHNLAW